ncbi:MAG: tetratricopeptide repeat protein [Syntrophaceae bacterium]|nr:tetratricopeptide repeat protein [Syntrophaceae bacterium]
MKKKYVYFIIIFLIVASCAAFGRIVGNDFINLDDNTYITGNNYIRNGFTFTSVQWAFTNRDSTMWQPITWISLMFDWSIFGNNASGYHIINLLWHIGAVIFLFLFLFRTTNHLWSSAFAAAFFALHPLRVESVAWAAERKDVLSMFFGMACLYVYSFYTENLKSSRYFICLILFALALMSKSMLLTLPFVMLLLDYWPLRRFSVLSIGNGFKTAEGLLNEKIPFFILSIISGIITIWAQYGSSMIHHLTFPSRLINAVVSYVSYLKKFFFPVDLAIFYPFVYSFPLWQVLSSAIILTGVTAFVVYYFKKMPFLSVGWLWYLGTLVPVSGLVPVGTPMADHYVYLPSVGITIMIAWGIPVLIKNESLRKKFFPPMAIAVLCLMAVLTWRQCGYWKNSITIFNHALRVTSNNYLAHNNLAIALADEGKNYEAIDHYNKSINIKPNLVLPYFNRGISYVNIGKYQLAIEDYSKALSLTPDNAIVLNNRGIAHIGLHQYHQAIKDFSEAIILKNNYANAYNNRGLTYFNQGEKELGCRDAQNACELGNCTALELARKKRLCR